MKILAKIGKDSLLYYGLHFEVLGVIDKVVKLGVFQTVITIFVLWWVILVYNKSKKKYMYEAVKMTVIKCKSRNYSPGLIIYCARSVSVSVILSL
ncbi:hypothetical protein DWZ24_11265 [Dorea formicigenerans]|uniref:Uncharacterized protein n=1 Tax=Dorea formicigenerans TaxID=39486 RepID=A0A415UA30_9FIRM|nr:hypothetical protein DWZ24_11265 [Dorea formicigenerans]